ncbi:MAG: glycosyltransferase [Brevinematia bacterium]
MLNPVRWLKLVRDYKIIKKSGLFDEEYYLRTYSDVRKADVDALWHFVKVGWKEGRSPSAVFDTKYYLETYPDVREAGINPLVHYFKWGVKEGRNVNKFSQKLYFEREKNYRAKNYFNTNEKLQGKSDEDEYKMFNLPLYGIVDLTLKFNFKYQPKISILLPVYNTPIKWLVKCINSIRAQYYPNWELCIVDDGSTNHNVWDFLELFEKEDSRIKIKRHAKNLNISEASNTALEMATGDYILLLDHDDEIPRNTLYEIVKLINMYPEADLIYSDDCKIDENGKKYDFQFKPDWSPELFLSYCYISHFKVFRKSLVLKIGGFRQGFEGAQDYDLALRICELTNKIYHIPKILYFWRALPTSTAFSALSKPNSIENGRRAVEEFLKRKGIEAEVIIPDFAKISNCGIYKINFRIKDYPLVTIIIPTKDNLKMIQRCVESILNYTNYPNYKLLIIDTGSKEYATFNFYKGLEKDRVDIKEFKNEKFNFSKSINYAMSFVESEYVLFLNNDTEVINGNWLEEMVGTFLLDNKIAVVGAKLIYSDRRVQHAGVILGLNNGLAGHANKLLWYEDGGYLNYNNVLRNYSAVTAACMLTKKDVFYEVGGFDENSFAVAYNDVDYCLKALSKGYRVVYNPFALLYHKEGATRGVGLGNDNPREEENFREKWKELILKDPYYNPNLSLDNELFRIKYLKNRNKKLLFVSHNLNLEGAPISLFLLIKGLSEKDYDITILSPVDGPLNKKYIELGVDIRIFPELFERPTEILSYFFKEKKVDIAILNTILSFPLIETFKIRKIPLIWIIRESEREYYFSSYNLRINHFKSSDFVVFVSEATKKVYSDLEFKNNFVLIYNGIDLEEIENFKKENTKTSLKRKYGFNEKDYIVLNVGTTCKRKGQKFYLEAAKKVLEKITDRKVLFFLIGVVENNYSKKLYSICKNFKENVFFLKHSDNIYEYFMMSDLYVCTSLIESLPRTILEAMAFELPIISTNVYGIPEEIENGKSGILIEPANSELLAEKICCLINDKKYADMLGKKAYERVKEIFTLEKMVSSYEKLIWEKLKKS